MSERLGVRPKRALFATLTDHHGGAERVTMMLARVLAARPGWEVEVFVACAKLPVSFTAETLPPNVRVRYGPWTGWHLSTLIAPLRLIGRRYDFVFSSFIYLNAMLSLLRRLKLIRIGRLVVRESMSLFDRFGGPKTKIFAALYRCYGGEDLLVAQTSYMADHVRPSLPARSAARLAVVPNPVDAAAIRSAAAEPLEPELEQRLARGANILVCGRLVRFKRPDLALDAFRIVAGENPAARLVFLGSGPLETELRRRTADAGLAEQVLFLGYRPNPYPVMAACQYGLLTSDNEGFPNVVLEMMACGVGGIVVTPCAGDLNTLSGIVLTRTHDASEIGAALKGIVDSAEDRQAHYWEVLASRSVDRFVDRILASEASE